MAAPTLERKYIHRNCEGAYGFWSSLSITFVRFPRQSRSSLVELLLDVRIDKGFPHGLAGPLPTPSPPSTPPLICVCCRFRRSASRCRCISHFLERLFRARLSGQDYVACSPERRCSP